MDIEIFKYISIPVVAAVVGWGTNWVAIKMLFYPVHPIGKPPYFGWQGILPSKAAKMGKITTETTLSKLGTLYEVIQSMDPNQLSLFLYKQIEPNTEEYVDWVMLEENPSVWNVVPKAVKKYFYSSVQDNLPDIINDMVSEISEKIEELVDIKNVVVSKLVEDKSLVNKIFLNCGAEEFKFIVRSGIYFGFLFGLIQMVIWYFFSMWWILPLFGIIVGFATNWIALRIIFQPLNPHKIGPFVLQGLFLKRQEEVSEIWCKIVAEEIITIENIIESLLKGENSEKAHSLIRNKIKIFIDKTIGLSKPLIEFTLGDKFVQNFDESVTDKIKTLTSNVFKNKEFNIERAFIVKEMMRERMVELSSEEFQYLLRPAFQEDEIKLILLGAVLGLIAGMAQLIFVFGGF